MFLAENGADFKRRFATTKETREPPWRLTAACFTYRPQFVLGCGRTPCGSATG